MSAGFLSSDPERLLRQADLCRRASAATRNPEIAARLRALAEEYLAEAGAICRDGTGGN